MIKSMLKNTDWCIYIITVLLFIIGCVGIYSAGYNSESNSNEYIKQLIWFAISTVIVICIWFLDNKYFELIGYIIYAAGVILLVLVLFTSKIMGASSWFNLADKVFVQPSEIMKIGYILSLSSILSKYSNNQLKRKDILIKWVKIFFLFAVPFVLIILQPDFGTAIAFVAITAFMLFVTGVKYRYVFLTIMIGLLCVPLIYGFVLNDTQKQRIQVFLNPDLDPLGSGYNAIQSKLAVGSGMIFGSGILNGTQTQYGYLPIKSSDFIFSVLSEEMGFVMSTIIILLFTFLIIRLMKVSANSQDLYNKYVVAGIRRHDFLSFCSKCRYDIWCSADNRRTTSFCKLWWK